MIKKSSRRLQQPMRRPVAPINRQTINSNTAITSSVRNRAASRRPAAAAAAKLTPEQRIFANQLRTNLAKMKPVMAATNTTNIMARPDFLELLPMFVQELYVLDVFGSVAMKSRQQLIPYFKFIAEQTKGETAAGDILSSPFVNRQGLDPNFTGNTIKNEIVAEGTAITNNMTFAYTPVLPGSVTIKYTASGSTTAYVDDGQGNITVSGGTTAVGYINYSTGAVSFTSGTIVAAAGNVVRATYQYDNENVGPRPEGNGNFGYEYGAQMAKGYLQLDEITLKAEAHELACYWSIFSAFAASQEYGSNVGDIAKEAAFSELTAEINTKCFQKLLQAATFNPQFNWDASPVLSGSVVPSDYLNMFKLKLNQAASSIYQSTRLTRPNRLIVGTNVASYLAMIDTFKSETPSETVGPYKAGQLDQFVVYCDPSYNPDTWVMSCKSNDIRRNSALFGEYMPMVSTDAIGLANSSVQQGYATMYSAEIVNPASIVSGKILGTY